VHDLHQRRPEVLRDDSGLLRLHGVHAQGRLHLLHDAQQHPGLLRLLAFAIADCKLQIANVSFNLQFAICNLQFAIALMQSPQLLIYEPHPSRLAELLSEPARARGWSLRLVNHTAKCLRALRNAGPAVLLIRLGAGDLVRELTLLERAAWLCPEAAVVVVGETVNPTLAGLAWDLGAAFVLFPPQSRELLPDLIAGFLQPSQAEQSPWNLSSHA
jgi:hypothetical protein